MKKSKGGRKKPPQAPTPKSIKSGFNLNKSPFRWSFEKCFWEHKGWQKLNVQNFAEKIISKLQNFETMIWQKILDPSGGKSEGHGNNNHFVDATQLPKEEKKVFIKHKFYEKFGGKVFSLRLSAKERLIGVVDMGVFKILWFDADHEFF